MTDCSICLESLNRSSRAPSACPSCAKNVCRTCIQTYLLQDDGQDAKCPSCKVPWTHTFLYSTLTSAFRLGPYKQHREKVLYDKEKARLPDTQEEAARYKNAKALLAPIKAEIATIRQEMGAVPAIAAYTTASNLFEAEEKAVSKDKTWEERRAWWRSDERIKQMKDLDVLRKKAHPLRKPYLARLHAVEETLHTPQYITTYYGLLPRNYAAGEVAPVKERRAFIMKCPQETCAGFLSQQYKCGMCEIQVCPSCHVTLAAPTTRSNAAAANAAEACHVKKDNEDHVCDQELVETIKQIKKEARPCPKCASLISKIDGCDQMWCTQCNTAFSWNTGKIEEHVIHNPHYFAWMRATGQTIPRMGEGNACAEIAGLSAVFIRLYASSLQSDITRDMYIGGLEHYHRGALHIQHITLGSYRRELQTLTDEEPRRILRVRRLVNELSDEDWKFSLQKKEKATYKVQAWIQLLEMYVTSCLDTLAKLKPDFTTAELLDVRNQLDVLRAYIDTEAAATAKLYSCVKPYVLRPPAPIPAA